MQRNAVGNKVRFDLRCLGHVLTLEGFYRRPPILTETAHLRSRLSY